MRIYHVTSALALAACSALALPQSGSPPSASTTTSAAATGSGSSLSVPGGESTVATSISTAIPSPTVAVSSPLFNASLPEEQSWCAGQPGSRIYCPGEILQTVQLAELYADSKTFVDKPTIASEDEVVNAFYANVASNGTVEALIQWIDTYFAGEGLDVLPADITNFNETPSFLQYVTDEHVRGWIQQVHGYWRDLVRVNIVNESCVDCASSQIPLNRSFVVPGGRFRENYYWDSFFILEGLLTSGLEDLANNTIQNYLDLIDTLGFIPNGGRIYYLNRSQPPLFTQMLYLYVTSTNDTSFLERAVRINDEELLWWDGENAINVTSPSGTAHFTHRYYTNNSAPRPESYAEDWQTVNGPIGGPYLNLSTDLYSDIASGAESGMDYSAARWFTEPLLDAGDTTAGLRTININEQIPVDLESILYRDYRLIAEMYEMVGNSSRAQYWSDRADRSRAAIIDLHWDSSAMIFKDYNMSSNALSDRWSVAAYYPYWSEIFPDEVLANASSAQKAFSGLAYLTAHYNGSIPISLLESGQQWDYPNVWPPNMYIMVKAIENIPRNLSQSQSFANYSQAALDWSYLPPGHFVLEQGDLPGQPILGQSENITSVSSFDELGNLGNSSTLAWGDGLATALVQRYISSAYCSWYSTGGSIPGLLPQLSQEDLNATDSVGNTGNMFEKFSAFDLDAAGAGGEYEVQAGFGWTNGVAIWFARNYGSAITEPACPAIELEIASADSAMLLTPHRNMALRPNLVRSH